MRPFYLSLLAIILIQIVSCKKETVAPIDFSKYTATDSTCSTIGIIDSTDWTYEAEWNGTENSLMYFKNDLSVNDSLTGYIEISPPCLNPSDGLFIMGINTERECKMKIACVNTKMEVLFFEAKRFTGGPILTAYDFRTNTAFHKNMNYRMYYAFYTSKDSVYYKGHGDFRIE